MPLPRPKLIAFDVDGPLYDGYMLVDFARYLFERELFQRAVYRELGNALKEFKAGKIKYNAAAPFVVQLYGKGIAGQRAEKIMDLAESFVRENRRKFFPKSVERLRNLKKQGKKVVLLSLSSAELVTAMGKVLKIPFDYYQGSWFRSKNGRYTGETTANDIHAFKKDTLIKMGARFKLPRNRIRMRGDAPSDLASAMAAHVPFDAMNPTRELKKALQRPRKTVGRTIITRPRNR